MTVLPDVPEPPPLQLNGLRFSVDRERFLVQAKSIATGETVWESTGMDRLIIPGDAFPLISHRRAISSATSAANAEQLDLQTGRFLASRRCRRTKAAATQSACRSRNGHFVTVEKASAACVFDLPERSPRHHGRAVGFDSTTSSSMSLTAFILLTSN